MNFELKEFGETIKQIRKNLKLTQADVFDRIGINPETMRRMENGSVLPKFETLDLLSEVYKIDVCAIFLKHRISDFNSYELIKSEIESKMADQSFEDIDDLIKKIDTLLLSTNHILYKNLLTQLKYFIIGVSKILNEEYEEAENILMLAIKTTIPDFNIKKLNDYFFSNTEIRILGQIARILSVKGDNKEAIRILYICSQNVRFDSNLKNNLMGNLAALYNVSGMFEEALKISDELIDKLISSVNFQSLAVAYFTKGRAEFGLKNLNYNNSFIKSLNLLDAYKYEHRLKRYKKILKEEFNLNLEKMYQDYTKSHLN